MLKLKIVFIVFIIPFISGCNTIENLHPCKCNEISSEHEEIICHGLENEQTFIDVVHALRTTNKIYSFIIENSNFRFLPHDVFKGIKVLEFKIVSSTIASLTDTDIAFEGQEGDLASLVLNDCTILNSWDWSVLRNLKNLKELSIEANLDSISEDIDIINSTDLLFMSFANNKIGYVHHAAFSAFEDLLTISLKNNAISEVKRSMLPDPAPFFWNLDFSHNEIQQLPSDMFSNMPSLSILNLDSNQLLMINEKPFSDVWSQLQSFSANNNHLRCDCRMTWITKLKKPESINAFCDQPLHLKGKNLQDITEKDIWC